jgi:choline-sulfatase
MYNLTLDPLELNNLAGNLVHARTEQILKGLLADQCAKKRLTPSSGSVAGQPTCS